MYSNCLKGKYIVLLKSVYTNLKVKSTHYSCNEYNPPMNTAAINILTNTKEHSHMHAYIPVHVQRVH